MRFALLLVLTACQIARPQPTGDDYTPPDYPGQDPTGLGCHADSECPGQVCARTHECLPASEVHAVRVTWTMHGTATSTASCANTPDLEIQFYSDFNDSHGYAPVPCSSGVFSIDKLPLRFTTARLGLIDSDLYGADIDAAGVAAIDLPY